MKIAQIAPLAESVPPRLYGGTEVACAPRALRLDPAVKDALPHLLRVNERVRSRAHEFDVLHFHLECGAWAWARAAWICCSVARTRASP